MFIKRSDFQTVITFDQLDQVIPEELDYVLNQAIQAGLTEVQSYLRSVYDVTKVLPTIPDWSAYVEYEQGEGVWFNDKIYTANVDIAPYGSSGTTPDIDSNWSLNDFRDQKLVQVLIDIVLYHVHKRVSPRQVPQHRLFGHDQAIHWLDGLRKGELSTDLPTVDAPVDHPNIFSAYPRQQWRF